ncbi:protein phosphatase type 1 complex subunit Hex2/Reg1 [Aspergillus terreus]|uniref:Protein phosphatase type 1 complex subunit Hex2/Reg1 n=1 Tax=Aspergillus terreus TaxID=33178 RepID=A0A5M3ZE26_ASPTE|nr:hypothetical protein ATETN484_0017015000 [Aspergillus terreus]GFF21821.1 protein phosphatase type 1 complex subunit Hex2/Reg1 [Aspergillus terreus]
MTAVLPAHRRMRFAYPSHSPTIQRYFLDDSDIVSSSKCLSARPPPSVTSSAPSSLSPSPNSTPTTLSNLSLDLSDPLDHEDILFPAYDITPGAKESDPPSDDSTASVPDLPRMNPQTPAVDDSALEEEPSRHVDYLSHEWEEEDIWASWRYVIARRNVYDNGARLENASWRTWAKVKLNRGTVSPETLNWLKDCDVTWLYGPLKTCKRREKGSKSSPPPSCLETPTSYQDRKPILKKRTASETILQRSLSQHTLLQHAGDILKAQEAEINRGRPSFSRCPSDIGQMLNHSSDGLTQSSSNGTPTNPSSSGISSPSERRHIHFNNEVVQCIAVEAKGDDEDDPWPNLLDEDLSSDDGVIMMQRKPASPNGASTPRGTHIENKTIAPLPSTTLKYRADTPEPSTSIIDRWSGYFSSSAAPAPSASTETLRPSDASSNFFLAEEDDVDFNWEPSARAPEPTDRTRPWFVNPEDEEELDRYLHFSSSGMFMPYDDGEPSHLGIFDRVVDTVNTARDIAHVIWNVGWRR